MDAVQEFELRSAEISPNITAALRHLGDRAIAAYASVGLFHNTLSHFLPHIENHGLVPDSALATPDHKDVDFATELFERKGYRYPASESQFNILIRGMRGDRQPGVFFYPLPADATEFRNAYGVPERLYVLAREMGCVMLQENGPFTQTERKRAREIFENCQAAIAGKGDSYMAVIRANPFSPNVINHRLEHLPGYAEDEMLADWAIGRLKSLGYKEWEGIYIPGGVPAADLQIMNVRMHIPVSLREESLDPAHHSTFFYTPPHLQRTT